MSLKRIISPCSLCPLGAVAVMLAASTPAAGQAEPEPAEDALDQTELIVPRASPTPSTVRALRAPEAEPPYPGLTGSLDWYRVHADETLRINEPKLLPEGHFLSRRHGVVRVTRTGHRVFVPDPAERLPGEGPMLLAPAQALDRLEAALADAEDTPIVLSGEVLVYHGLNYLIPTAFARASEIESAPEAEAEAASLDDDPEIEALIGEIERAAENLPRGIDERSALAPVSPQNLLAEGTYLSRRRGRLVRLGTGAWIIAFDGDIDTALDPALTIIPCRLLMQMERLPMNSGEGVEVVISGRITTYHGRNYILPTLYQRQPDDGLNPSQ